MKNKYTYDENEKLIEDIKKLQNYEGYIQFSDTKIRDCDIFKTGDSISTKIQPTDGFIYEAHFCNDKQSISVKQLNNSWYVTKTDISNIDLDSKNNSDINVYLSDIQDFNYKVKMAQIWDIEEDKLCEKDRNEKNEVLGFNVKKLKKVVFVGFQGVEK